MKVVRSLPELKKTLSSCGFIETGHALVPTMGALHQGHLSLLAVARKHAPRVSTTIFVNPKQFGPNEDLDRYPRQEAQDLEELAEAGCDLVYVPTPGDIYPPGHQTTVRPGALAAPLDGASRPGYFEGIATVVTKLFTRMQPTAAVFGEKDFQQLLVIRQLSADLDLGVDVIGAPTVRETDGLAMSSRNAYLSPPERRIAGELNVVMRKVCARISGGVAVSTALVQGLQEMDAVGLRPVDYLELRSAETLAPMPDRVLRREELEEARLFAAVTLGKTRLIDNMSVLTD